MNTIEKIDELHSKATPGMWFGDLEMSPGLIITDHLPAGKTAARSTEVAFCADDGWPIKRRVQGVKDAQLIAAMHRAWPAISAVLKQAERVRIDMTYEELLPLADALTELDKCMTDGMEK